MIKLKYMIVADYGYRQCLASHKSFDNLAKAKYELGMIERSHILQQQKFKANGWEWPSYYNYKSINVFEQNMALDMINAEDYYEGIDSN